MVLINRWTAWNKSSFTGTPGKRRSNLSTHLQQLSMHITSILKRSFKLTNIGQTCHWITWPVSFKTYITDLFCLIHLPSLFLWKPMSAAALNVWSQLIHFAPVFHILLNKSLRFEKRRYIYLCKYIPSRILTKGFRFLYCWKGNVRSFGNTCMLFCQRIIQPKCFFSVSKSMSVLGSNKVFYFLDPAANLY